MHPGTHAQIELHSSMDDDTWHYGFIHTEDDDNCTEIANLPQVMR